jgi:soluble lytic murein transglycosylase-like protein
LYTGTASASGERLYWHLDPVTGETELARLELHRTQALAAFGTQYRLPPDLTELIYDIAVQEGIDPDLAFRLVRVESGFNPRALSSVGAIGLAQVMVATARFYERGITAEGLYAPATNLRIGFRYLYDLLETYDGDLELALLAYNRGPGRVNELLGAGRDPRNGYSDKLTNGYRATGDGLP